MNKENETQLISYQVILNSTLFSHISGADIFLLVHYSYSLAYDRDIVTSVILQDRLKTISKFEKSSYDFISFKYHKITSNVQTDIPYKYLYRNVAKYCIFLKWEMSKNLLLCDFFCWHNWALSFFFEMQQTRAAFMTAYYEHVKFCLRLVG